MDSKVGIPGHLSNLSVTNQFISTHHNIFERHHRFIGWLGLAVSILKHPSK